MLFSKVFYPALTIFGFAALTFASPIAEAAPADIEVRQTTTALSVLQNLQSAVAPIVDQLNQAAATGANPSPHLNDLRDTFQTSANSIKKLGHNSVAKADVTAVINISLNIFLDIILVLGKFSIINIILSANIDVFLSGFLSALDVVSPGVAAAVGKGFPSSHFGLLVVLRLVAFINILGLGGLLGGLLGIIGL